MKKFLLALVAVFMFSSTAMATTLGISGQVTPPPIVVTRTADLVLNIPRVVGTMTYNTTSAGWSLTSPAAFTVSADSNVVVNLTIPATVGLARNGGWGTATLNIVCRADQTTSPASAAAGVACGISQTTSATGALFLALFPTSITFGTDALGGVYSGTLTVSVNY